jgi:hypothetical protein
LASIAEALSAQRSRDSGELARFVVIGHDCVVKEHGFGLLEYVTFGEVRGELNRCDVRYVRTDEDVLVDPVGFRDIRRNIRNRLGSFWYDGLVLLDPVGFWDGVVVGRDTRRGRRAAAGRRELAGCRAARARNR